MQSTGHSSMQALSLRSTQGCAMTYVTTGPPVGWSAPSIADVLPRGPPGVRGGDDTVADAPDLWQRRVGQRVVVRRRLPDGSATDVVGPLTAVDDAALTVAGRGGEVRIPLADVV